MYPQNYMYPTPYSEIRYPCSRNQVPRTLEAMYPVSQAQNNVPCTLKTMHFYQRFDNKMEWPTNVLKVKVKVYKRWPRIHLRQLVKTQRAWVKIFVLSGGSKSDWLDKLAMFFLYHSGKHSWFLMARATRFLWLLVSLIIGYVYRGQFECNRPW